MSEAQRRFVPSDILSLEYFLILPAIRINKQKNNSITITNENDEKNSLWVFHPVQYQM